SAPTPSAHAHQQHAAQDACGAGPVVCAATRTISEANDGLAVFVGRPQDLVIAFLHPAHRLDHLVLGETKGDVDLVHTVGFSRLEASVGDPNRRSTACAFVDAFGALDEIGLGNFDFDRNAKYDVAGAIEAVNRECRKVAALVADDLET